MNRTRSLILFVLCLLTAAPALAQRAVPALGGLDVMPTRVVFEGSSRSAVLTLRNTGTAPATYRIAFVELKMNEQGQLLELPREEKPAWSAAEMIRYSPRQVTLQPGVTQTVRLQLRKPAGIAEGEYRSHLTFTHVPDVVAAANVPAAGAAKGLGVELTAVFGVSIPVIVRQGGTRAEVSIADARLIGGAGEPEALEFALARRGNQSTYGHVTVVGTNGSGQEQLLAQARGVGVYDGVARRTMRLSLPKALPADISALRIRYSLTTNEPLASADVAVR